MTQPFRDGHLKRWRLGKPEKNELDDLVLKRRYREVLLGFERFGFTAEQILSYVAEFEQALADLEACKACKAQTLRVLKAKDAFEREYTVHMFEDCESATGNGFFLHLSQAGCRYYGRPAFAVTNCISPVQRKEEIAAAWRARSEAS